MNVSMAEVHHLLSASRAVYDVSLICYGEVRK